MDAEQMTYEALVAALEAAQLPPERAPGTFTRSEVERWCRLSHGQAVKLLGLLRAAGRVAPCWVVVVDDWGTIRRVQGYRLGDPDDKPA